jgi:hypothetical protein
VALLLLLLLLLTSLPVECDLPMNGCYSLAAASAT